MPGVDDPERVKKLIGDDSEVFLNENRGRFDTNFPTEEAANNRPNTCRARKTAAFLPYSENNTTAATNQNQPEKPKQYTIVEYPAIIDGSELRDASAYSQTGNESDYQITFNLKPGGAQKFGEFTGKNIGKNLAIVLNNEVKSAPTIQGQIFDTGQITGRFTKSKPKIWR